MLNIVEDFIFKIKGKEKLSHDEVTELFYLYGKLYKTYESNHQCHSCIIKCKEAIYHWYSENKITK